MADSNAPSGIPPGTYPGSPDRPVRYDGFAGLSWLSKSELAWLIERLPTERRLFIEVGTASGVTAAKIADARPDLTILCVDSYVDSDDPRVAESEPGRIENWVRNRRPNMHLFVGTLAELVLQWHTVSPRVILVDGDHSEGGAGKDLILARQILDPGGTIFAHDCDEPDHPGVTVAVDSFCESLGFDRVDQHWTLRALRRR